MAKQRLQQRIAGAVLLAVGAVLAVWAYRDSQSVSAQVADALGAGLSQEVVLMYLAGAACAAVGVFLIVRR